MLETPLNIIKIGSRVMSNYLIAVITILLFSTIGCTSSRQLILDDLSIERVELPFKIDSLVIVDNRDTLLPMGWDVPLISAKKKQWEGNPALSELNRSDITTIINKSSDQNGIPAYIKYSIVEGVCNLNVDWKNVIEFAKYRAEIVLEIPSRNLKYTSYAQMQYDHPTLNGTEAGCMRLYNQAVKNVTQIALKQIKEEVPEK